VNETEATQSLASVSAVDDAPFASLDASFARRMDLWGMPPKVRPSDLVNNLKTVLSRQLRKEFPALRIAYRGNAVLWSPSYCIISAGGARLEILRRCVENQKKPD